MTSDHLGTIKPVILRVGWRNFLKTFAGAHGSTTEIRIPVGCYCLSRRGAWTLEYPQMVLSLGRVPD
jgi:hypothetical protein